MRRLPTLLSVCLIALCCSVAQGANYFDGRGHDAGRVVRGSRASITTAPIPDLHGGDVSCAWVMVCTDDRTLWAQAGYILEEGTGALRKFAQFKDVNGRVVWRRTTQTPASGDHTYECLQDGATGVWIFKYDDAQFATSSGYDTRWAGSVVPFCGEVVPDTSVQMVGDSSHKVKFITFRQYNPGCPGGWQTIWPEEYHNDSPAQWGQDVSQAGGYFKIWDTTP